MTNAVAENSILLVDDGELDGVAELLTMQGRPFARFRGSEISGELPPPRDLLVMTPRHAQRVRRDSPPSAAPGYPLRVVAVDEDSPAIRRHVRSVGAQLLVRLPADDEIWRLLIARAVYRGHERRQDPRVTIGSPVNVSDTASDATPALHRTMLIDLSNRGCRLQTTQSFEVDQSLSFKIKVPTADAMGDTDGLTLRGSVRRIVHESGSAGQMIAMTFDDDLTESTRAGLTQLINRWASGTRSTSEPKRSDAPAIPACRISSLPGLMLDDETDPPVRSQTEVCIEIPGKTHSDALEADAKERRSEVRGHFDSSVVAESREGPIVLIGRDLSPSGMRVGAVGAFQIGDDFRLALHGPGPTERLIVDASVVRDDGQAGFALAFRDVDDATKRRIEKLVACLPDVESLEIEDAGEMNESGDSSRMGAILSELISD